MFEFLKRKWVEWLISIALVILTVVLTNRFAIKRDTANTLNKKLDEKASIEYVDKRDSEVKHYVDTKTEANKDNFTKALDAQTKLIESMDHKIDILLTNERNR